MTSGSKQWSGAQLPSKKKEYFFYIFVYYISILHNSLVLLLRNMKSCWRLRNLCSAEKKLITCNVEWCYIMSNKLVHKVPCRATYYLFKVIICIEVHFLAIKETATKIWRVLQISILNKKWIRIINKEPFFKVLDTTFIVLCTKSFFPIRIYKCIF